MDDYLFSFLKYILLLVANLLTGITNNIVSLNCNVYLVGRFNYLIQFTIGYHNNRWSYLYKVQKRWSFPGLFNNFDILLAKKTLETVLLQKMEIRRL